MSEGHTGVKNVLVDLGTLSQPITKLIEVVAQGTGNLYKPVGTVLQAYADRMANVIIAEGDEKISEIRQRAATRVRHIEIERQKNLDAIIEKAHEALPEKVSETPVPKDWITHFFDAAQDVSDQEMQKIWARILAREVAAPGATAPRTLEFLKTMTRDEAEAFKAVLSVSLMDSGGWYNFIDEQPANKLLEDKYATADVVNHMQDIGILGSQILFLRTGPSEFSEFFYGGVKYRFAGPKPRDSETGAYPAHILNSKRFTNIGQQLSSVAGKEGLPNFISDFEVYLQKHGVWLEEQIQSTEV